MESKMIWKFYVFTCMLLSQTLAQNIPPSITEWSSAKRAYIPPNIDRVFKCGGQGSGNLEIQWYKDEKQLITSNTDKYELITDEMNKKQTLKIKLSSGLLKDEDVGFYQCRIKNAYGVALSDVTWLRRSVLASGENYMEANAQANTPFHLECPQKRESVPTPIVTWVRANGLDDAAPLMVNADRRIQIDNEGSLHFSSLILADSIGDKIFYRCKLQNSRETTTSVGGATYKLNVQDGSETTPMNVSFHYVDPPVGLIGGNVTLGCFFSGGQNISISWQNDKGTSVSNPDSSLSTLAIKVVKKSDEGTYTCTGTSGTNKASYKIQLNVKEAPTFIEGLGPRDQTVSVGSPAEFKCITTSEPPAVIAWFINGEPLSDENLPKKVSLTADRTILKIENVCKENCPYGIPDMKVVQCNASNIYGYAFANGYLNVLVRTEITTKPQDVEYNPEEVAKFYCDARTDKDTLLSYRWLFNDKPFIHGSVNTTSQTLVLDIPNLPDKGRSMIGKWSCFANNTYSNSTESARLKEKAVPAYIWPYWWVVLLVLLLFLLILLIILIVCCYMYRNRGDQYPVDEIEQKNGNNPEKELEDAGFHDFQRDLLLPRSGSASGTLSSQDRTLSKQKRSQGSLSGSLGRTSNEDVSAARSNIFQ